MSKFDNLPDENNREAEPRNAALAGFRAAAQAVGGSTVSSRPDDQWINVRDTFETFVASSPINPVTSAYFRIHFESWLNNILHSVKKETGFIPANEIEVRRMRGYDDPPPGKTLFIGVRAENGASAKNITLLSLVGGKVGSSYIRNHFFNGQLSSAPRTNIYDQNLEQWIRGAGDDLFDAFVERVESLFPYVKGSFRPERSGSRTDSPHEALPSLLPSKENTITFLRKFRGAIQSDLRNVVHVFVQKTDREFGNIVIQLQDFSLHNFAHSWIHWINDPQPRRPDRSNISLRENRKRAVSTWGPLSELALYKYENRGISEINNIRDTIGVKIDKGVEPWQAAAEALSVGVNFLQNLSKTIGGIKLPYISVMNIEHDGMFLPWLEKQAQKDWPVNEGEWNNLERHLRHAKTNPAMEWRPTSTWAEQRPLSPWRQRLPYFRCEHKELIDPINPINGGLMAIKASARLFVERCPQILDHISPDQRPETETEKDQLALLINGVVARIAHVNTTVAGRPATTISDTKPPITWTTGLRYMEIAREDLDSADLEQRIDRVVASIVDGCHGLVDMVADISFHLVSPRLDLILEDYGANYDRVVEVMNHVRQHVMDCFTDLDQDTVDELQSIWRAKNIGSIIDEYQTSLLNGETDRIVDENVIQTYGYDPDDPNITAVVLDLYRDCLPERFQNARDIDEFLNISGILGKVCEAAQISIPGIPTNKGQIQARTENTL